MGEGAKGCNNAEHCWNGSGGFAKALSSSYGSYVLNMVDEFYDC
jgi:hypothetical protein